MTDLVFDASGVRHVRRARPTCPSCGEQMRRLRETKRCPGCGLDQPASEFAHSRIRADHLDSACRSCVSARKRMAHRVRRADKRDPDPPVIEGVIIGHLLEHRGIAGHYVLSIADAVGIDRWTGERQELGDIELVHRHEMRFPFGRGDRLVFALSMGVIGKVYHPRHARVLWEDHDPDLRLDLPDLLKLWFPNWPGPPEPFPPNPSWPWTRVDVACPFASGHEAQVDIDAVSCPVDTGVRDGVPDAWDAPRVLEYLGRGALARKELSAIEDEKLLTLALETP